MDITQEYYLPNEKTPIPADQGRKASGLKVADMPWRPFGGWNISGWGDSSHLALSSEELLTAKQHITTKPNAVGRLRGSSLSGNSMTSSVFYAFPAVVGVASIFSPISLLVACLILFLWRPVFLELRSAIFVNGANYTYLLQFSGRTMALIGASVTILDSLLTSTESAITAAAYLQGEFTSHLALSEAVLTLILLIGGTILCLLNIRSSSFVTLTFFAFHGCIMLILMIGSMVSWGRNGSTILLDNWNLRPRGGAAIAKAIFNGVCVGFLGVTGFETTPTYVQVIRREAYPAVLSIVLVATTLLNGPLMFCVYVVLPTQTILRGTNILSILADEVAGKWLRVLVVIDCVLVLSGGVVDGICSANALIDRLARDHVFPKWALKTTPYTGSQYIAVLICLGLDILIYICSGFSLVTCSAVFTITFLLILMLFVISNLMLKLNCDELPRDNRYPFLMVVLTLAVDIVLLVGNVVLSPIDLALFIGFFAVIAFVLFLIRGRVSIMKSVLWIYSQCGLHLYSRTEKLRYKLISLIKHLSRHPVVIWVAHDEIAALLECIRYIQQNESTSRVIIAHAYRHSDLIPPKLESNVKILDEAFPTLTLDFMLVQGSFDPILVDATSQKKNIPVSRMFMICPSPEHQWEISDYKGIRIIPRY